MNDSFKYILGTLTNVLACCHFIVLGQPNEMSNRTVLSLSLWDKIRLNYTVLSSMSSLICCECIELKLPDPLMLTFPLCLITHAPAFHYRRDFKRIEHTHMLCEAILSVTLSVFAQCYCSLDFLVSALCYVSGQCFLDISVLFCLQIV